MVSSILTNLEMRDAGRGVSLLAEKLGCHCRRISDLHFRFDADQLPPQNASRTMARVYYASSLAFGPADNQIVINWAPYRVRRATTCSFSSPTSEAHHITPTTPPTLPQSWQCYSVGRSWRRSIIPSKGVYSSPLRLRRISH